MTRQMRLYAPQHSASPPELAAFCFGEAPEEARWSEDRQALLIPHLRLAPSLVRHVVAGGTLYRTLYDARLVCFEDGERCHAYGCWSYAWGDLLLFETGEPAAKEVVLLRGAVEVPDLSLVHRYVRELRKA